MNRIVLLGTGGGPASPAAGGGLPGTSALLDLDGRSIIVDAGPGTVAALTHAGADPAAIGMICITHLHAGHMLDLGALAHAIWTAGRTAPVTVMGPPGIESCWQGFLAAVAFDTSLRAREAGRPMLSDLIEVRSLREGTVEEGPLTTRALSVPHPPVEHAFALRFDGSRSVVFSGDTSFHLPLADFARGADVLLHSAYLPGQVEALAADPVPGNPWARARAAIELAHTAVGQTGRMARLAGVGHLVLHHQIPAPGPAAPPAIWAERAKGRWDGPLTVGHDGMVIPL